MNIIVTGASGMAGRELVALLAEAATHRVVASVRNATVPLPANVELLPLADLEDPPASQRIAAAAANGGTIVHLAALTPGAAHGAQDFQRVNAQGTEALVRAAIDAGVAHIIYLSSAHVCGALTTDTAIREDSAIDSHADAYGLSKFAGEEHLKRLAAGSNTKWTIVRAPLVYGPGVKGSLAMLTRAVLRGIPLPLGAATTNARDMIGLRNLAEFLKICIENPAAANEIFVVRDGTPVATRRLIEEIATAAGTSPRLIPVPLALLKILAAPLGGARTLERLLGDQRIDDGKARRLLGWSPPQPLAFDIGRMVKDIQAR